MERVQRLYADQSKVAVDDPIESSPLHTLAWSGIIRRLFDLYGVAFRLLISRIVVCVGLLGVRFRQRTRRRAVREVSHCHWIQRQLRSRGRMIANGLKTRGSVWGGER